MLVTARIDTSSPATESEHTMSGIEELVTRLTSSNNDEAYKCLQQLQSASAQNNAVYQYLETFIDMLDSDNSYIRTRGALLISANAKWDSDNRIDEIIDKYLKLIHDEKPVTARQCIQALPNIAWHKPDLAKNILFALQQANFNQYSASMQPLIAKDIQTAIHELQSDRG